MTSEDGRDTSARSAVQPDLAVLSSHARTVRRDIINMTYAANSGHPGGSLSAVEILVALYFQVMRHNPRDAHWPLRDRFIMSKGHATPVLYATLAESGYFPVDELSTFRTLGSRLQGHTIAGTPPGVELTAGSLGQGLSYSIGQCLAGRLDAKPYHVYCLLGDGELNEGQVWEAAMCAAHYRLDNLTAIIDRNHIQNDGFGDDLHIPMEQRPQRPGGWVTEQGYTVNIMSLEPLADKWKAFGWNVVEADGHGFADLLSAFHQARQNDGKPSVIIAHTIKGKGVSFMENNPSFHGKAPNAKEYEQAMLELA